MWEGFCIFRDWLGKLKPGGEKMKEDEKKLPNWEMVDPKPPVIRSGHMENRRSDFCEQRQSQGAKHEY